MKKNATVEEKVSAISKMLVKEIKSSKGGVYIGDYFTTHYDKKGTDVRFSCNRKEISFGDLSDESYGNVTCKILNEIRGKLKLKKSEILNVEKSSCHIGSWYSSRTYDIVKSISIVRPCKGFFAINKKLVALGLKPINFKDWYYDYVSGKRSSIFDHDVHYYAESEKMCSKVLDYLKGKKKVSYEFFDDDDLEDRERGERYETEWSGKMSKKIVFKDSKGNSTRIY